MFFISKVFAFNVKDFTLYSTRVITKYTRDAKYAIKERKKKATLNWKSQLLLHKKRRGRGSEN